MSNQVRMQKVPVYLSLLVVLSLIFAFSAPKDTSVTVKVDTQNINARNVDQMVTIVDSNGSVSTPGRNKDFTSIVYADKWIVWKGAPAAEGSTDVVLVTRIVVKNGADPEILKAKEATGSKTVRAKINNEVKNGTQSYAIHFTVIKSDGSKAFYQLDPKLKMQTNTSN